MTDAPRVSSRPTAGERLLDRELEQEMRGGFKHYVPGQHEAMLLDDGDAVVGYVDVMGHACLVGVETIDGEWAPVFVAKAQMLTVTAPERPPEGFTLSERMIAALDDAVREAS